jgi:hypothetical protein
MDILLLLSERKVMCDHVSSTKGELHPFTTIFGLKLVIVTLFASLLFNDSRLSTVVNRKGNPSENAVWPPGAYRGSVARVQESEKRRRRYSPAGFCKNCENQ